MPHLKLIESLALSEPACDAGFAVDQSMFVFHPALVLEALDN